MFRFFSFISFVLTLMVAIGSTRSFAKEFVDEVEKDFTLRSIGRLQIVNAKGDISVQGWAMDKIRIKLKKKVAADTVGQAKEFLEAVDYRYSSSDNNIEISSQYGTSLSIAQRLKEAERPRVQMDMIIYAPSNLKLNVWSIDGKVNLKGWSAEVNVRTRGGSIRLEGVKADSASVSCSSCSVQLKNIKASVRCIGGSGELDLNSVSGEAVYVQTGSGLVKLWRIEGDQLYISETGKIDGQFLNGKVSFQVRNASIGLREISGFLSGSVKVGDISASVREWKFQDKALIESSQGNIALILPRRFAGDVDFWSVRGKLDLEFPIDKSQNASTVYGPEPDSHVVGRVSDGGELLKVFTGSGNITILRGKI